MKRVFGFDGDDAVEHDALAGAGGGTGGFARLVALVHTSSTDSASVLISSGKRLLELRGQDDSAIGVLGLMFVCFG